MTNWLLMFKPDTFEVVKDLGVIGVLHMHRRRFAALTEGDRFVAYLSRRQVLAGYGVIASAPFQEVEPIFPGRERYPQRCRVTFQRVCAGVPAGDALWELDAWKERETSLRTQPWNMLFCYGGFMEIPDSDFERLRGMISACP